MKISSANFFESAIRTIQSTQSDVARTREKISSGKELVRASDDTGKLRDIEVMRFNLQKLGSFDDNLNYLKGRLDLEETVLGTGSDILIRMTELALQASNDTLTKTDRQIISTEVATLRDELLAIANTQDVEGNYIFSGSRTETPPYAVDFDSGEVTYSGDSRKISLDISPTRRISRGHDGPSAFRSANRTENTYVLTELEFTGHNNFQVGDKTISFAPNASSIEELSLSVAEALKKNGVAGTASVRRVDGKEFLIIPLSGNDNLAATGVPVTLDHAPSSAVQVGLLEQKVLSIDYFEVLGEFLSALDSNDLGGIGRSVSEIRQLQDGMSIVMGEVGSSINNVQRQLDINADVGLTLEQLLSSEEDLDYAKAVTQFNQELVRLEAAQSSFARVAQLSLFEYL